MNQMNQNIQIGKVLKIKENKTSEHNIKRKSNTFRQRKIKRTKHKYQENKTIQDIKQKYILNLKVKINYTALKTKLSVSQGIEKMWEHLI